MTQEEFNQHILRAIERLDAKFDSKFDRLMYSIFGLIVGVVIAHIGIIALFIRG